ncbi:MAG: Sapep family Mn(2+)-dependent dipeptidase [Clostridia bacterium]|nr:Sapep family Mn(2+)-dependent dipeptidase [Clostridia bacterium]
MNNKAESYVNDPRIRQAAVDGLIKLISYPSVSSSPEGKYPFGRPVGELLDHVLSEAEKKGFEAENHDYYCGSLLLKGKGDKEIGILSHLDVVPAGNGWSFEPFKGIFDGNVIIGRGACDNKDAAVAAMLAMNFFKENNIELPFTVRLILGCSEETGMGDLPHFLESRPAPDFTFTPDSTYPVCVGEKGIAALEFTIGKTDGGLISVNGGTVSNAVADLAEAVIAKTDLPELPEGIEAVTEGDTLRIVAHGTSAHASRPEGSVNAITKLAAFIVENGLIDKASSSFKALEALLELFKDNYGSGLGIAADSEVFGRLTCVGGVIRTEEDGSIVQNCNIRYPAEMKFPAILDAINDSLRPYGSEAMVIEQSEGYYSSPDKPQVRALTDACSAVLDIDTTPYVMGGGTYSRHFPNAVTFGMGIPGQPDYFGPGKGTPHQRDEYTPLDSLMKSVKIFILALDNLAKLY